MRLPGRPRRRPRPHHHRHAPHAPRAPAARMTAERQLRRPLPEQVDARRPPRAAPPTPRRAATPPPAAPRPAARRRPPPRAAADAAARRPRRPRAAADPRARAARRPRRRRAPPRAAPPRDPDAPQPLRLFVALDLPDDVRDALAALGAAADQAVWRPVAPEALHVTLAFLGSRPPEDVAAIAPIVAAEHAAPPLALGDVLLLPPRRARVLTVALDDPTGALRRPPGARRRPRSPTPASTRPRRARSARTSPSPACGRAPGRRAPPRSTSIARQFSATRGHAVRIQTASERRPL